MSHLLNEQMGVYTLRITVRGLFIPRRVATLEDGLGDWPVSKPENATQGGILQVLVLIKEIPPHRQTYTVWGLEGHASLTFHPWDIGCGTPSFPSNPLLEGKQPMPTVA